MSDGQEIIETPTQAVAKDAQPQSVEMMLVNAVNNNVPVETIEKLMAMRREIRAEQAKEAFDLAMSKFQGECPIIKKNEKAEQNGKKMYSFSTIDEIVKTIQKPVADNGFSYSFKTEITNERVKVFCIVKHNMGHSETTDVDIPMVSKTGIMNAPQQVMATVTFAKRYALKNAFGIETGDADIDAVVGKEKDTKPTQEQLSQIDELAATAGYTKAQVVQKCKEKYGVSFSFINQTQADGIIAGLRATIANKK